jgi:hypothetical protein
MYGSGYIFGKTFFAAWVVIAIIWVWGTMFVAGFFPIIDGWAQLKSVYKGLKTSKQAGRSEGESEDSRGNSTERKVEGK